ncbi:MAG: transcriptional regulator [Deltaproteobacteria bacterium]|nr:MAG: transcriptional regulator [Deltaproteobacteria bacterium]
MTSRSYTVALAFTLLGVAITAIGHAIGLFVAPAEAMMGDVGRILYVHVPTAWNAMLVFLFGFGAAVASLWTGRRRWDAWTTAAVEVGTVLTLLLLVQGSLWAKPTWGVYWTWDPRLTTSAVLGAAFGVVLLLRRLIDQPARRQVATAVATIVAFVDVPIVYMSVRWWNSLHQTQSTPKTIDKMMAVPLWVSAVGILVLSIGLVIARWRTETARLAAEERAPDLPDAPAPLHLDQESR